MHARLPVCDPLDERQFLIAVKRLANSLSYGSDASPFVGSGVEYIQSRPYIPGDPVRHIDWRVSARTGKIHVKEFEAPKRLPFYILIDTSASMCVGSAPMSKYAWAVQIAGGLALAAQQRLSPAGILGCGTREFHLRPSLSRTDVLQSLHELRHVDYREATALGRRLEELSPTLEQRCLLIVLSDLHDPEAVPALKLAAQEHDLLVLHLEDPAERGRIGGGIFRGREAETGRRFVAHGRSRWLEPAPVRGSLRRAGIDCVPLAIDKPFLAVLRTFLRHRAALGRVRG